MKSLEALEGVIEEVLVELEEPMSSDDCCIEEESKISANQNRKRSKVKFYRAEPYPLAAGLLAGFKY